MESTGSVDLLGQAVIEVRDPAGMVVYGKGCPVAGLAPGQATTCDAVWDTAGVSEGVYNVLGFAQYDGRATEPTTAEARTVETVRELYLPLARGGPAVP